MAFAPVLHSEWLKIRTLRSLPGALLALFAVTTAFSALAGTDGSSDPEFDPLFTAMFGILPGQIAAIAFGALAVSSEYHGVRSDCRSRRFRSADAGSRRR